jgi:NADPH-dependent ferric siderophore reductase
MPEQPDRRKQSTTRLVVRRTERVNPHLIRINAAPSRPEDLDRFITPHSDAYVKVLFRKPGVRYPEPLDMATAREELPREQWPALRTYTLREVRPDTGDIVIDFVYHGDSGLAGPWAASASEGSEMFVVGPGGAYSPDLTADWHLLVGDDSALPAIAASLTRIPPSTPVHALIEVTDVADEQPLETPGLLRTRWLHRARGESVVTAVRELVFPSGRVHAFVHGEAGAVKELRRHLREERGLTMDQLSISGYWRLGFDDEGHREMKAAERAAETASAAS